MLGHDDRRGVGATPAEAKAKMLAIIGWRRLIFHIASLPRFRLFA